jgi:spore coat protein CotF
MDTNRKASPHPSCGDRDDIVDRTSLGDALIVSSDEGSTTAMEKMLNDNLDVRSVDSDGDEIAERFKHTWQHPILIDLH